MVIFMFQKRICTKIISLLLVIGCLMSEPVWQKSKKNPKRRHCIQNPAPWWMVTVGAFCMERGTDSTAECKYHKILTCIVAMEQCKPDEVVTFSAKAASQPKVHLGRKRRTVLYAGSVVWADAGIL